MGVKSNEVCAATRWAGIAALAAGAWLVALAAAAWTAGSHGISGLGSACIYTVCAGICHQLDARSLHLAGAALPVCARCLGLYTGGWAGLSAGWILARWDRTGPSRRLLAAAVVPTLVDGVLALLGLSPFGNLPRLLLALPAGAAVGLALSRGFALLESEYREARPKPSRLSSAPSSPEPHGT